MTPEQKLFDLRSAVLYLKSLGAESTTLNFVRGLVANGLPHLKIGKRFYVSKSALDRWLEAKERKR